MHNCCMSAMPGLWNVKIKKCVHLIISSDKKKKKNQALDTFYLKENSKKKIGKITSASFKVSPCSIARVNLKNSVCKITNVRR